MSHAGTNHKQKREAQYIQQILQTNTPSSTNKSLSANKSDIAKIKMVVEDASKKYTDEEIGRILHENGGDVQAAINVILDKGTDTWKPANRKKVKESGQKPDGQTEDFKAAQHKNGNRARREYTKNEESRDSPNTGNRYNRERTQHQRPHKENRNQNREGDDATTDQTQQQRPSHHKNSRFHYKSDDTQLPSQQQTSQPNTDKSHQHIAQKPTTLPSTTPTPVAVAKKAAPIAPASSEVGQSITRAAVKPAFSYKDIVSKGIVKEAPVVVAAEEKNVEKDVKSETNGHVEHPKAQRHYKGKGNQWKAKENKSSRDKSESSIENSDDVKSVQTKSESDTQFGYPEDDSLPEIQDMSANEPQFEIPSQSVNSDDLNKDFSHKQFNQTKSLILPHGIQDEDTDICFGNFGNDVNSASENPSLDHQNKIPKFMQQVNQEFPNGSVNNSESFDENGNFQNMFPGPNFIGQDPESMQDFMRRQNMMMGSHPPNFMPENMGYIPVPMQPQIFIPPMHMMHMSQQHMSQQNQNQQTSPPTSSSQSNPNAQSGSGGQYFNEGQQNATNIGYGPHYGAFFPPYQYMGQQPFFGQGPPQFPQMYNNARFPMHQHQYMPVPIDENGGNGMYPVMGQYPYYGPGENGYGPNMGETVTPPGSSGTNSSSNSNNSSASSNANNSGVPSAVQPPISGFITSKQMAIPTLFGNGMYVIPKSHFGPQEPQQVQGKNQDIGKIYSGGISGVSGQSPNNYFAGSQFAPQPLFSAPQRGYGN